MPTPPLSARWTRLEPLSSEDVSEIFEMLNTEAMHSRWPRTQLPAERSRLETGLCHIAALNYVARSQLDGRLVGLMQGIDPDASNLTISFGAVVHPNYWRRGWPFESVILMLNLLFEWHGYRKIYCQFGGDIRTDFNAALRWSWLRHEATLQRHEYGAEGLQDQHIYALYRDDWDSADVARRLGIRNP